RYLCDLCEKNGIHLTQFPAMNAYLQYVMLSESIDAEKLLGEVRTMEENGYASLAKTSEERRLVEKSRKLYLTGKLLDFALTREEWEEYKSARRGDPLGRPHLRNAKLGEAPPRPYDF